MRRLPENLVIQFFLLSSVILAGIPWILAAALTAEIRQYAIDALVDEAVLAAKASLLRDITPADLKIPMRGERYSRFHEFVQSSIVSGRTARVKLWSEGGTVIYSDDPAGVGEKFPLKGNLLKALGGQNSAAEIEIPEDAENVRGRHPGTLMGVYIPIIFPAASDPRGVFEIHRYYGPAAERIKALEGWNFGAIGGGFLFLYGSLVFIVWRGWRKIKGQEEALLQNERELKNLAYYDSLTGLPNRQLFYDRLRQTVALARRRGSQAAVMFLDLDGFKRVNDTLGHNAGDLLLQSVAQRLSGLLRQSDTIARQGGDEFTLILDGISRQENVVHVAQNIMDGFSQPFEVEGHELFFATSIG
ncbi:MAG: diguanylate cyclase domain-containing protein, partial [Nitrospinota bacterium]